MRFGRTLVCLAVAGLLLSSCTSDHTPAMSPSHHTSAMSPSPKQTTSTRPLTSSTSAAPTPRGFRLYGASFISDAVGWVLGQDNCTGCANLLSTRDGGRTWQRMPAVPAQPWFIEDQDNGLADILFADSSNGFVFTHVDCSGRCSDGVLATHDGGRTWHQLRLPSLAQVGVGDGYVFALTASQTPVLWRSAVGTDTWTQLAQPSRDAGLAIAVSGSTVLMLRTGHPALAAPESDPGQLWQSTDAGQTWTPRTIPCHPAADGVATMMSIALKHPRAWLIDCFDDSQSQQAQDTSHHLYGTANAGQTWVRLVDPSRHGVPNLMADNGSGRAVFTTSLLPASTMEATVDGAATWRPVITADDGGQGHFTDLEFTSADVGYVAAPASDSAMRVLYKTTTGGARWTPIRVEPPPR